MVLFPGKVLDQLVKAGELEAIEDAVPEARRFRSRIHGEGV